MLVMAKAQRRSPARKSSVGSDRAARSLMVDGNRLTFLPDGPERLDALLA